MQERETVNTESTTSTRSSSAVNLEPSSSPNTVDEDAPQSTLCQYTVKTFTTRQGDIGVKVDGNSYRKRKVRKRDNVHIILWLFCIKQCHAVVETLK